MIDIEELQRLAMEATPGPWKWWTSNSWRRLRRDAAGIATTVAEPFVARDGHPDLSINETDMAYIAACHPQAILSLLATIRADRERIVEVGHILTTYRELLLYCRAQVDTETAARIDAATGGRNAG